MARAFDRALELHELRQARDTYAWRYGEPGSVAHRAAWLRFHQRIKTIEELEGLRRNATSKRRQLKPSQPAGPADRPTAARVSQPSESMAAVA